MGVTGLSISVQILNILSLSCSLPLPFRKKSHVKVKVTSISDWRKWYHSEESQAVLAFVWIYYTYCEVNYYLLTSPCGIECDASIIYKNLTKSNEAKSFNGSVNIRSNCSLEKTVPCIIQVPHTSVIQCHKCYDFRQKWNFDVYSHNNWGSGGS